MVADPSKSPDDVQQAQADLAALMTDEQMLEWAHGSGLDARNRDQLLDALAVGFTVQLWRNTVLEDIHAPNLDRWLVTTGRDPLPDRADPLQEVIDQFHGEERAAWEGGQGTDGWTWFPDDEEDDGSADDERLEIVVDCALSGFGIPDDVMLRANAYTAATVRHLLEERAPEAITASGNRTLGRCAIDDMPEFMWDLFDFFVDPDRELQIGGGVCSAYDLIGSDMWDAYVDEVGEKYGRAVCLVPAIGVRRALWLSAISGVSYAGGWYPCPQWKRALARASEMGSDAFWGSNAGPSSRKLADRFWMAAEHPYQLNGLQAKWMINSHVDEQIHAVRREDATALGVSKPTFSPLIMGLF